MMYNLQLFLSLVFSVVSTTASPFQQSVFESPKHGHTYRAPKRIAIVGGGTSGLSTLKTLLVDIPENLRRGWEVELFEQREDVGGVWYVASHSQCVLWLNNCVLFFRLPDPIPPRPPALPETPLYPLVKTNTPHPISTYRVHSIFQRVLIIVLRFD
jgi:hypothetical protein